MSALASPPATTLDNTDESSPACPQSVKLKRVLACALCQQRKVKCDRKIPCTRCIQAGAQSRCVAAPTVGPRQRRRRFPERELLERLRFYEGLLRENGIEMGEPLHPPIGDKDRNTAHHKAIPEPLPRPDQAIDFVNALGRIRLDHEPLGNVGELESNYLRSHETDHEADPKKWGDYTNGDLLFFSTPSTPFQLLSFHPTPVQILKIWQIYLENVHCLLRVTHAPTLQARIIDAISNMTTLGSTFEALLFSIYCISVASITEDVCLAIFESSKADILAQYQMSCKKALLNSGVFHSADRDGLTALFLYMMSFGFQVHPRSLACVLVVAIRIAKRMNMQDEAINAKHPPLEAEMRRRLWWSLVIFDHRISELSDYKDTALIPTWDCGIPSNLNDQDIRHGMQALPSVYERPTEAVLLMLRSEMADFLRHSAFHINFINPSLNILATPKLTVQDGDELQQFEKLIEEKYLVFCDPENPLHFMTIWTARGYLARINLLAHYSRQSVSSTPQTDVQRAVAISHAMNMLECDTKLWVSPLTKGYTWLVDFHAPGVAYNHLLIALSKWPTADFAETAWKAISENYQARDTLSVLNQAKRLFFARVVLQTWEKREAVWMNSQNEVLEPPGIIQDIRDKLRGIGLETMGNRPSTSGHSEQPEATATSASASFNPFAGQGFETFPELAEQAMTDVDMDQFWTTIDWTSVHTTTT